MPEEHRSPTMGEAPLATTDEAGRVRAVLLLGGVPFDDLDDGLQQVRLKLLEADRVGGSSKVRNLGAWAAVVASRVAADWHRSRTRDARLRQRLALRWDRRPPAGQSEEQRLLSLAVADGLERLTAVQRQVLTLRFYADLSVRQIAILLDVAEGTVKSRLHSAMSAMRTTLREEEVI